MMNCVSARFNPSSASLVCPRVSSSHDSELAVSLRPMKMPDRPLRAMVSNEGRERVEETIGGVGAYRWPRATT